VHRDERGRGREGLVPLITLLPREIPELGWPPDPQPDQTGREVGSASGASPRFWGACHVSALPIDLNTSIPRSRHGVALWMLPRAADN
jgi:hypothetical protein